MLRSCCMEIIFYLPVNTDKPKSVAFLAFVSTTASFIAQISSAGNVSKIDAILAPVAKQWRILRVTGANENVRKLLFTDLVNTKLHDWRLGYQWSHGKDRVRKGNRLRGGDHTKNILFSSSLNKTKAGTAGRVLAINIFIEDDIQP